jgi:hypothetical protein
MRILIAITAESVCLAIPAAVVSLVCPVYWVVWRQFPIHTHTYAASHAFHLYLCTRAQQVIPMVK